VQEAPVRAVILDYGGVVYAEDASEYDSAGAKYGLPAGRLWAACHEIPEYGPSRRGEIDRAAYLAGVARALAREIGTQRAGSLVDEFQRERAAIAPVTAEMAALLPRLQGRVRLGLLSNAGSGATARLADRGVAAHFDDVVCSGDVGLMKPDPAVFRLAALRLGVEPAACFFVDDMERHVLAARSVGMRAHCYERAAHDDLLRLLMDVGALPP
jgi:putative hydrolase of the HAD superfamily